MMLSKAFQMAAGLYWAAFNLNLILIRSIRFIVVVGPRPCLKNVEDGHPGGSFA